ncbi:hypothetical protein LY76DRAFT_343136 [Colletotrichum caudatum]|nr:hypothetical protein LY76DRAFT_343136 [Colletotrichum caudatum]
MQGVVGVYGVRARPVEGAWEWSRGRALEWGMCGRLRDERLATSDIELDWRVCLGGRSKIVVKGGDAGVCLRNNKKAGGGIGLNLEAVSLGGQDKVGRSRRGGFSESERARETAPFARGNWVGLGKGTVSRGVPPVPEYLPNRLVSGRALLRWPGIGLGIGTWGRSEGSIR